MCPTQKRQAPAAATLPTTQALDELQLATGDALDPGTPSGRLALSTRPRTARKGTTAAASAAAVTADPLGLSGTPTTPVAAPPQSAQQGGSANQGNPASDLLGFIGEGRQLGSRQPFFTMDPAP